MQPSNLGVQYTLLAEKNDPILGLFYLISQNIADIHCYFPEVDVCLKNLARNFCQEEKSLNIDIDPLRNCIIATLAKESKDHLCDVDKRQAYESLYYLSLLITKYWPRNLVSKDGQVQCPISTDSIQEEEKFLLSDGYQFDVNQLLLMMSYEKLRKHNPVTRADFHPRDLANIGLLMRAVEEKESLREHARMWGTTSLILSGFSSVVLLLVPPTALVFTSFLIALATTALAVGLCQIAAFWYYSYQSKVSGVSSNIPNFNAPKKMFYNKLPQLFFHTSSQNDLNLKSEKGLNQPSLACNS